MPLDRGKLYSSLLTSVDGYVLSDKHQGGQCLTRPTNRPISMLVDTQVSKERLMRGNP